LYCDDYLLGLNLICVIILILGFSAACIIPFWNNYTIV